MCIDLGCLCVSIVVVVCVVLFMCSCGLLFVCVFGCPCSFVRLRVWLLCVGSFGCLCVVIA